MRNITKALAICTMVAATGGVSLVAMAETSGPGSGPHAMHGHMGRGMMTGMRGSGDPSARLASLKTELDIRPEQEEAWNAYAKVMQDNSAQMQATRKQIDMTAVQSMSPQDRQGFMTGMREQREQRFATLKTAAQALLPSLDAVQKAKAQNDLPGLREHGRRMTQSMQGVGRGMRGGMGMMGGPTGPAAR